MKTTTRVYAGVDVSKDRLDVCLRWSEPESHKDVFFVTHDDAGIDTLVSRLLEECPVLVILEATGGFDDSSSGTLKRWSQWGQPRAKPGPTRARTCSREVQSRKDMPRIYWQ